MYALASKLVGLPILSLQNAETLSHITGLVMEPGNLEVLAIRCQPTAEVRRHPVILMRDVRQFAIDCILIDAAETMDEGDEIVRLTPLLEKPWQPVGLAVVTDLRRKVGHVEDFTVNLDSHRLQKLYVRPPLLRSLIGSSLIIDRNQVIDVTPKEIVVRDTVLSMPATSMLAAKPLPEQAP